MLGHLPVLVVDGPALLGGILQRVSRFCVPGEGDRENEVTMTRRENGQAQPRASPTTGSKAFSQVAFTQCFILAVCLFCWHLLNYLTKKSILLAWFSFCWEESVSNIQRAPDSTQQLSGSWLSLDLAQSQLIRIRP